MNKKKLTMSDLQLSEDGYLLCPKCNGFMSRKSGAYGDYWGCNNYKTLGCKFSIKYLGSLDNSLIDLVKRNEIEKLKDCIKSGNKFAVDNNGNTLLMLAVIYDQEDLAKALVESNIDVNQTDKNGNTALMLALKEYPNFDYRVLLEKNCYSIYTKNNENWSPLEFAIHNNLKGIILEFINNGATIDGSILRWAIKIDYIEFIERYFEQTSISVNAHDASGNTFLMYAIKNNSVECAEFFLKKGANIYKPNKRGQCALSLARNNTNSKMMELINKYKGSI